MFRQIEFELSVLEAYSILSLLAFTGKASKNKVFPTSVEVVMANAFRRTVANDKYLGFRSNGRGFESQSGANG